MCNNGLPGQALITVRYAIRWIIINGACSRPLLLGQSDGTSGAVVRHAKVSPASHDTVHQKRAVYRIVGVRYLERVDDYGTNRRSIRVQYRTVPTPDCTSTVLVRISHWRVFISVGVISRFISEIKYNVMRTHCQPAYAYENTRSAGLADARESETCLMDLLLLFSYYEYG